MRSRRERLIQALWFEAMGVLLVGPLFTLLAGASPQESFATLTALSIAVTGWSAAFNTGFDRLESWCAGRVASDRPHALRVVHTVGLEATAALVTWPLIVALTRLTWLEALRADLGLTFAYVVYGYFFHLGFDRLRPVRVPENRHPTIG
jgi:uncharacterized membrane protein